MNGYGIIFLGLAAVWFGPPLIMIIIGLMVKRKNEALAKKLFIAAGIYVLIGGGICGSILIAI